MRSDGEEQRVMEILDRLRTEVKHRGLLLKTFFDDFDKVKGYTRGITKSQFERVLHFLSLNLSTEEVKLIESKFEAGNGIDVNHTAFVQAIDDEYTGQAMEQEPADTGDPRHDPVVEPLSPEQLEMLVLRLREHVQVKQIRVSEHFQDADPLRANSITASRFRQGLSSMGKPGLSEAEFQALCSLYADPKNKGRVRWRAFMADMDHQVLESPVTIPQPAPLPLLPTGAVDFHSTTSTEQQKCLDHVLNGLRAKINLRRVLAKPVFQDFDWHNMGYVTCKQFSQCLSFLGLEVSETELELLQVCFKDGKGFNYLKFLAAVQPVEKLEDKYSQRIAKLLSAKDSLKLVAVSPGDPAAKLEEILEKIKIKVSKKRARIHEFMKDYDKLRTGRVSKINFARGLDLCGFELDPQEVALLQNMYSSPRHPDFVEYLAFSDEIESVFTTKGLEKYPTAEVQVFVPPVEVGLQPFNTEESELFEKAMHRLAEAVRVRRIQLYPLFEDYDRQHIGSITKTQFQRVLSELELAGLLDAREFVLLFQRFDEKVGGRTDINYIAFAEMCYDYAQEKWPES